MATCFFKPTDTIMVATSPRIGVGLGSDSQGSVTLFHKYCFPNLYWIHWAITGWSDSAINSNTTVHIILLLIILNYCWFKRIVNVNFEQQSYYNMLWCNCDTFIKALKLHISKNLLCWIVLWPGIDVVPVKACCHQFYRSNLCQHEILLQCVIISRSRFLQIM